MSDLEERGIKYILDATDYVQGAQQVSASSEKIEQSALEAAQGLAGIDNAMRSFKQSIPSTTTSGFGAMLDQFPLLNQQLKEAVQLQKQMDQANQAQVQYYKQVTEGGGQYGMRLATNNEALQAQAQYYRAAQASGVEYGERVRAAQESANQAQVKYYNEVASRGGEYGVQLSTNNEALRAQAQYAREAAAFGVEYGNALNADVKNLAATRYALYDVANTWKQISLASLAAMTAVTSTGMSFETAFTGVERTADLPVQKLQELRDEVVNLSTEIPESFSNLSEISTLGGQLGIAGENLDSFAENVAKFSTTTNASIDATATGFGRIAQLTDAGTESFDAIGSAIYTVGVNSVATETEIMDVAQEIATAGNLAGFSTADIIGLSGALASLGVQPERARGNIQRIFAEIDGAVNEGGSALESFSKLSDKSSEDFVKSWKSAPSETFVALIDGLSRASDSGQSLDGVLSNLGVNAVRDVQTMKQLADNTDLLHQTMSDANTAYGDATSLSEAYGSTADNLASKLTELLNSVKGILDQLSQNAALGWLVDKVKDVTNGFLHFLQAAGPVGDALGFVVTTGTLAVGVFGAITAATMTLRAGYLAMLTAQTNLTRSGATLDFSLKNMIKSLGQIAFTTQGAVSGLNNVTAAAERTATATSQAGAAQNAASSGSGAASMLAGWAKGGAIMLGVSAAMWGASKAVSALSLSLGPASDRAAQFGLSFEGLSSSLQADMDTFKSTGEAVAVFKTQADGSLQSIPGWTTGVHTAADAQALLAQQTKSSTGEIQNQIVVMGQQSAAAIAQQIGSNETLTNLFAENADVIKSAGLSYEGYVQALAAGQGEAYIARLQAAVDGWAEASTRAASASDANASHYVEYLDKTEQGQDLVNHLKDTTDTLSESLGINANSSEYTARAQAALGVQATDTDSDMSGLVNTTAQLADTLLGGANTASSFQGAMYSLGESLYQNGADFSAYSEAGRSNLSALAAVVNAASQSAGNDAVALSASLQAIIASLSSYGVNVASMFPALVQKAGVANVGKLNTAMSQQSVSAGYAAAKNKAYASSARSAGSGAVEAAKQVYTLSNYVSDLSSVMKNAFDFRWGLEKSTDDLADSFQKLVDMKQDAQDAVTDAFSGLQDAKQNVIDLRSELAGLNADIAGLSADKTTLTYQLGVARDYGDTLRENEILAELAKNQTDLADKQNDVSKTSRELSEAQSEVTSASDKYAKAQQDAKRSLDGGSASSREQRAAVLDLVQSYEDQIKELANSGLSTSELATQTAILKQRFIEQMTQLGYNISETQKYARTFDDLIAVIGRVPRNITISANTDPAQRAINEFLAQNRNGRGASSGVNVPVGTTYDSSGIRAAQRDWARMAAAARAQLVLSSSIFSTAYKNRAAGSLQDLANGGFGWFDKGGFTGRGGKYDPAGIVHKGEFVVRKELVNQSTGLPYADAMGAISRGYSGGGYVRSVPSMKFPTTQIVELSPTDRALLAAAGNVTVTMDGRVVARATNSANTNQSRRG